MMTKKELQLWSAWTEELGTGIESPLYKKFRATERRNVAQRARRASPEAKAKEALASRKSKARRTTGYYEDCGCSICRRVRAGKAASP